mmetsp:Transcript_44633/g.72703  ORF Transcript_44633/g.72703 Transcript_44633/m.72703 type:complete len:94 (-) Transcript_44633:637-918(-)
MLCKLLGIAPCKQQYASLLSCSMRAGPSGRVDAATVHPFRKHPKTCEPQVSSPTGYACVLHAPPKSVLCEKSHQGAQCAVPVLCTSTPYVNNQ